MKREIKFRVVNEETGRVYDGVDISEREESILFGFDEGEMYAEFVENGGRITPLTIIQYTGLKDKNGLEIYEGDILKTDSEINYVDFQDYSFCTHDSQPLANYVTETNGRQLNYTDKVFEVIGNIHQHKHLLEVSQ